MMESLRSQLLKNAILTIGDCFEFFNIPQVKEHYLQKSLESLLKKASETNSFINTEAQDSLAKLIRFIPFEKAVNMLHQLHRDRAQTLRKQISLAIVQMMEEVGSKNLWDMQKQTLKMLFEMVNSFLFDANQEVRINASRAILTLEYGPGPMDNRTESIKLISQYIKDPYDLQKSI